MRRTPLIAVGTALALGGAVVTGPANAADGVGTTTVSASLLRVDVGTDGSLLNLRLVGDDARATVDPAVGAPQAHSRLTALTVGSSALPAPLNNITVPNPPIESRTPGGSGNVTAAAIDLANPATGVSVPAALLSGAISPATLTSAVDANGSRSTLAGELSNLAAVGGLVSAQAVATTLGATSGAAQAEASRVIGTQAITVLDLGALLDGLGIAIADLPVSTVTGILDQLGIPVGNVAAGGLDGFVDSLQQAITDMEALIAGLNPTDVITGTVPAGLPPVLTGLGVAVPETGTTTAADVQAAIDDVQDALNGVLAQAMSAVDAVKLLEVEGVEVGTVARAKGKLADSVSVINAKIGAVRVGGITVPGVDLSAAAAQINAAVADVNTRIGSALGAIAPSLGNLVNVKLFDRDADNGTGTINGYNKAIAGLTAVAASITPPADLATVVSGLVAGTGIGETLTGAGGTVPQLSVAMDTLETALGSVNGSLQALAGGATVRVAELRSVADFVLAGGVDNPRELPRTGSNSTTAMALFGGLLAVLAVGIRRHVVRAGRDG